MVKNEPSSIDELAQLSANCWHTMPFARQQMDSMLWRVVSIVSGRLSGVVSGLSALDRSQAR